jgi:hypothetical protein
MNPTERQNAISNTIYAAAQQLPGRPTTPYPEKPGAGATDADWDAYNAAAAAVSAEWDAYNQSQMQYIQDQFAGSTLAGTLTEEQIAAGFEKYRDRNKTPEEKAREAEYDQFLELEEQYRALVDAENWEGVEAFKNAHPDWLKQKEYNTGGNFWMTDPTRETANNYYSLIEQANAAKTDAERAALFAEAEALARSDPAFLQKLYERAAEKGNYPWFDPRYRSSGGGSSEAARAVRQGKENLTNAYGPEAVQMFEQYLSLPKGQPRADFMAAHPELRAYNLVAYEPQLAEGMRAIFGDDILDVWANTPQWGESPEQQAERQAYLDAHPEAWFADAWLTGRPTPYDPNTPAEQRAYDAGKEWEEAKAKFGEDIWSVVFAYRTGDRSDETKKRYYAFSDWWNEAFPDDGRAYGGSASSGYDAGRGDTYDGPRPEADPQTIAFMTSMGYQYIGGDQSQPQGDRRGALGRATGAVLTPQADAVRALTSKHPPNAVFVSEDGLVSYDQWGRRLDSNGNVARGSYGGPSSSGGGGGGGGGSYGGGGFSGPPSYGERVRIREWRPENPWYSGSWLNAGRDLRPR